MSDPFDELFGQLRSLMNLPTWEHTVHARKIWPLVQAAAELDPTRYQQEWLPYIEGFSHHIHKPFSFELGERSPKQMYLDEVESMEELRLGSVLLPQARWMLYIEELEQETARTLAASSELAHVSVLDFQYLEVDRASFTHIATSEHLAGLCAWNLSDCGLGPEEARSLAKSATLGALRSLEMNENPIQDEGTQALINAPTIRDLRFLRLATCGLTDTSALALAENERWREMITLHLADNAIGGAGACALLSSQHLPRLRELNLDNNNIGEADMQENPATSETLGSLHTLSLRENRLRAENSTAMGTWLPSSIQRLDLSNNNLGGGGVCALLSHANLNELETLNLSHTRIQGSDMPALLSNLGHGNLRTLVLGNEAPSPRHINQIGDRGVTALASWDAAPGLEHLGLESNSIGTQGFLAMMRSPHLGGLRSLGLNHNQIGGADVSWEALLESGLELTSLHLSANHDLGDHGALALSRSPWTAHLKTLDLSYCGIGMEGAAHLAASPWLSGLTSLSLSGCPIGEEGARMLAESPHLSESARWSFTSWIG